jgi:dienelactone hydrolase
MIWIRWTRVVVTAGMLVGSSVPGRAAGPYLEEEFRVPLPAAGSSGLEALLVRPSEPGRYPLALLSHGAPRSPADRPNMTPWAMLPQAIEFARRGWAAVVVMRKGYGDSGGPSAEDFGSCAKANYIAAGDGAATQLKESVALLGKRPDIDVSRMIAVGHSAGGFATVALTIDPPPGLAAAINFAGGRGSMHDDEVCQADRLVEAFGHFGERSRTPMLWVYAENDHFFGPELAEQFRHAFTGGGGKVEFIGALAFGEDGHQLFSASGIPIWTGMMDSFLKQQGLVLRTTLLPLPPRPNLAAPKALSANGREAFETYLTSPPHKAFALAPDGAFGWQTGKRTTDAAKSAALSFCLQHAADCDVVFVDDAAVR